jgi:predicted GH43/DUF377 family glycosyl hydrolase
MCWLANSNYEVQFPPDHRISERVIFPVSKNESRGIEDARFVQFFDNGNERVTYYATYTAYNGKTILPQLIETKDFIKFNILTLNGKAVQNKGMALFPRKIGGAMPCSRARTVKTIILCSQTISISGRSRKSSRSLNIPGNSSRSGTAVPPWKPMKAGSCSPMASGPCVKYCIGAMLLDLEDPTKIIARLDEPLLAPHEKEREGICSQCRLFLRCAHS